MTIEEDILGHRWLIEYHQKQFELDFRHDLDKFIQNLIRDNRESKIDLILTI